MQNEKWHFSSRQRTHLIHARLPCLGDADRVRFANRSIPTLLCGRADNACTNLLGYFVRYVRTRGIVEAAESGKTADFRFTLLSHALATHGSRD